MSNSLDTLCIKLAKEPNIHVEALRLLTSKEQDLIARLEKRTPSGIAPDEVRRPHHDTYPLCHLDRLAVQSANVHVLYAVFVRGIHRGLVPLEDEDVAVIYHGHRGVSSGFVH